MKFESISARASEGSKPKEKEELLPEVSSESPKKLETAVNKFVGREAKRYAPQLEKQFKDRSVNAKLADFEKKMPRALEQAVEQINDLLVDFLKEWGLKEYVKISAKNIVLGDVWRDKGLRKIRNSQAGTYHSQQNRIRMLTGWKMGNYREFTKVMVHEMIHMQAFQSLNVNPSDANLDFQRRQGVRIYDRNHSESYSWLDEAITEELAKQFIKKHEKDIKILGGIRKPVVAIEKIDKMMGIVTTNISRLNFSYDGNSYKEQRNFLRDLITSIHIHGRKKYKNRDEIFHLFTNAALNGRLLPLARAIEKAKGRGSFKELAKLDINLKEKKSEV